jgi:hypothetical protein
MRLPRISKRYYVKFAGRNKALVIVRQGTSYYLYGALKPERVFSDVDLQGLVNELERACGPVERHGEIREALAEKANALMRLVGVQQKSAATAALNSRGSVDTSALESALSKVGIGCSIDRVKHTITFKN